MTTLDTTTQPLPSERSIYMQRAARQARQILERFAGSAVDFDPTALQLLDEWIDRMGRTSSLPDAARVLIIAFLGQTFLNRHGGYWATQMRDRQPTLGVVCPIAGQRDALRYIEVVDQVNRRLARGISESLAFFYLTTSVDLQGRS